MAVGMVFVKWPDTDKARELEKDFIKKNGQDFFEPQNYLKVGCGDMATNIQSLLYISLGIHICCGFLNIYREIFEVKLGTLG